VNTCEDVKARDDLRKEGWREDELDVFHFSLPLYRSIVFRIGTD
jgi:hypothetical protein